MTISIIREKDSGSLSVTRVPYFVYEEDETLTLDRQAAIDAATAQAFLDSGGTPVHTDSNFTQLSDRAYRFDATYKEGTLGVLTQTSIGDVEIGFSYQQQPERVLYSPFTENVGPIPMGGDWNDIPGWGGLVGVEAGLYGNNPKHVGVQVTPRRTHWIRATVANGTITEAYETQIGDAMGAVNNAAYRGKPAGSLRFIQCTSVLRTDADMQIYFGFDYRKNRTGYQLGGDGEFAPGFNHASVPGLIIPAHHGHDIVWTYNEHYILSQTATGADIEIPAIAPKYFYIERPFPYLDFATVLGI